MATIPTGKYGFKVLQGSHWENKQMYRKNDIIVTNVELDVIHKSSPPRFKRLTSQELLAHMARIGSDQQSDSSPVDVNSLEKMSIEELKSHAADEEIDLKGVKLTDKKAIIAAILAAAK